MKAPRLPSPFRNVRHAPRNFTFRSSHVDGRAMRWRDRKEALEAEAGGEAANDAPRKLRFRQSAGPGIDRESRYTGSTFCTSTRYVEELRDSVGSFVRCLARIAVGRNHGLCQRIFASPRTMNTATETLIQRLPEHVANQIAAGEVVQRPAQWSRS